MSDPFESLPPSPLLPWLWQSKATAPTSWIRLPRHVSHLPVHIDGLTDRNLPGGNGLYDSPLDHAIKPLKEFLKGHMNRYLGKKGTCMEKESVFKPEKEVEELVKNLGRVKEVFLDEPWYERHADPTIGTKNASYKTHNVLTQMFGWWSTVVQVNRDKAEWGKYMRDLFHKIFLNRDDQTLRETYARDLAMKLVEDWNKFDLLIAKRTRLKAYIATIHHFSYRDHELELLARLRLVKEAFLELPPHERYADPFPSKALSSTYEVLKDTSVLLFGTKDTSILLFGTWCNQIGWKPEEVRSILLIRRRTNLPSDNLKLARTVVRDWNDSHLEVEINLLEHYIRVANRHLSGKLPHSTHIPVVRHGLRLVKEAFLERPGHERYADPMPSKALDSTYDVLKDVSVLFFGTRCKHTDWEPEEVRSIFLIRKQTKLPSDNLQLAVTVVEDWNNSHYKAKIEPLYSYIEKRKPIQVPGLWSDHVSELLHPLRLVREAFLELPRHERHPRLTTEGTYVNYKSFYYNVIHLQTEQAQRRNSVVCNAVESAIGSVIYHSNVHYFEVAEKHHIHTT